MTYFSFYRALIVAACHFEKSHIKELRPLSSLAKNANWQIKPNTMLYQFVMIITFFITLSWRTSRHFSTSFSSGWRRNPTQVGQNFVSFHLPKLIQTVSKCFLVALTAGKHLFWNDSQFRMVSLCGPYGPLVSECN